jgi:hypothetical protein
MHARPMIDAGRLVDAALQRFQEEIRRLAFGSRAAGSNETHGIAKSFHLCAITKPTPIKMRPTPSQRTLVTFSCKNHCESIATAIKFRLPMA